MTKIIAAAWAALFLSACQPAYDPRGCPDLDNCITDPLAAPVFE